MRFDLPGKHKPRNWQLLDELADNNNGHYHHFHFFRRDSLRLGSHCAARIYRRFMASFYHRRLVYLLFAILFIARTRKYCSRIDSYCQRKLPISRLIRPQYRCQGGYRRRRVGRLSHPYCALCWSLHNPEEAPPK